MGGATISAVLPRCGSDCWRCDGDGRPQQTHRLDFRFDWPVASGPGDNQSGIPAAWAGSKFARPSPYRLGPGFCAGSIARLGSPYRRLKMAMDLA